MDEDERGGYRGGSYRDVGYRGPKPPFKVKYCQFCNRFTNYWDSQLRVTMCSKCLGEYHRGDLVEEDMPEEGQDMGSQIDIGEREDLGKRS